ncbi:hypothetical protein KY325_00430 [Candidatus Woesearchaeota archaeon]|nr:hypothetical protein [Candidatus Woesearchaeota archaeon]MBW3017611.1 hypothetical protein [Candidatus Woesearchaeota archaeon]
MTRVGRIVQLKKASSPARSSNVELIEGTLQQDRFGADVSFEAPYSMKSKLMLGTIVEFEPLPRKPEGRTVGERRVKIVKIIK